MSNPISQLPVPHPSTDETESEYMERCMGNEILMLDYPVDQRKSVCQSRWEKKVALKGVEIAIKAAVSILGDKNV